MSSLLTAILTLTLLSTPIAVNAQAQDENATDNGTVQPAPPASPQGTQEKSKKTRTGNGEQAEAEPDCD